MEEIKKAIQIIKDGGIVIYPTDTAYGIGCRIDSSASVRRLFEMRRRPLTQATPVLVDSIPMAEDYLLYSIPDVVRHLTDKYWPGALTVILPCKTDKVPPPVRGGGKNIGLRIPDHNVPLSIIEGVGVPILGPSANFHGLPTPCSFEQLDPLLVKEADFILKGECRKGNVSTVVDCSVNPWKIVRKGALNIEI